MSNIIMPDDPDFKMERKTGAVFREGMEAVVKGESAQPIVEGNKLLKTRGGKGDPNTAIIDGQVLTVAESLAKKIAEDTCRDMKISERKKLRDIGLGRLMEVAAKRVAGRGTTIAKVNAEIGRIFNREYAK